MFHNSNPTPEPGTAIRHHVRPRPTVLVGGPVILGARRPGISVPTMERAA